MKEAVDKAKILAIAHQVFNDEMQGIKQLSDNLDDNFIKVIMAILNCRGKVVVSGVGKSGHIARKIAATFASTGTPAFFMHPTEAIHGDLGMIESDDVALIISYSGEADEILSMVPALKRKQILLISMTANKESSLAKLSDYFLNIKVEKEACPLGLAPTTSTTVSLALGDALAVSLLSLRDFRAEDFALSHPGGILGRRLLITSGDLMHTGEALPIVTEDAILKDVVMEMSGKGLGFTAVLDKNDKLTGVITDGDLRRALDKSLDIFSTTAYDIMTESPKVLKKNALAVEAIELMQKYKITGFLVVDETNSLVGAYNLHDLFKAKLI